MRFATLAIAKDEACPVCGSNPSITQVREENAGCNIAHDASRRHSDADAEITPQSLRAKLDSGDPIEVLDVREPVEREIATLANTIEIRVDDLAESLDVLPRDQ